MIPKIIHQLAQSDKTSWHPIWYPCHESWHRNYVDFEHMMWTDEKIDYFILEYYPQYFDILNSTLSIVKIDLVRYMILYQYGGIYTDMDMYCYENFYDELQSDLVFCETDCEGELVHNALMAVSKNHPFMLQCIEESIKRLEQNNPKSIYDQTGFEGVHDIIKSIAGPKTLSDLCRLTKYNWQKLPKELYNNIKFIKGMKTRHMTSGTWGKEHRDLMLEDHSAYFSHIPFETYMILNYHKFRGIIIPGYNFEKE